MKLCATTVVVALAAALAVSTAGAAKPAPAEVVVRACKAGEAPRSRSAIFYARMRAAAAGGTARMSMRFELQDVVGDQAEDVEAPGLRPWRRSRPGVRTFGYTQKVAGLQAGGSYLVSVEYRWHDARGRVIREETRKSGECRQRGDLPNLTAGSVRARPGQLGTQVYSVQVTNTGRADARDVATEVFIDGVAPDKQTVAVLAPGETRTLRFTGPACRRRLRAVVDPGDAIRETTDDDNVVVGRCPPL